ncbi:MAG TPA: Amuc_1100 family pilus-like protein [Lacunisphaera sp.]|nr:Amuc_1100 family pilus-like protein [Lacunisphaera sp.]
MQPRRRITVIALVALAMAAGVEGWYWQDRARAARRALARLEAKLVERERLAHASPAPTAECEVDVRARIDAVRGELAKLRAEFNEAAVVPAGPAPSKPVEAYFEIVAFVERARATAAAAQVAVRAGERFGFATHAREGPRPDLAEVVSRQRAELQRLLDALFDSQPRALLAVQRERPEAVTGRARRDQLAGAAAVAATIAPARNEGVEDFFELDPRLSIREPGVVETDAFRLEFTGRTATLRRLLNRLAASRCPLVVRAIEAEPVPDERPASAAAGVAAGPVLVVSPNLSRFTVIVEMLVSAQADGSES